MVSVSEAYSLIQQNLFRPEKERIKLENSEGRILAENLKADRDLPPFDRVAMDGIAILHSSFQEGWRDFKVEGMLAAGQPRITMKDSKNCIEVMTGAMLPVGTDTVIRYEDISIVNKIAKVKVESVEKGQSVHGRAHDARKGDTLLTAGIRISTPEAALFATMGRAELEVLAFPTTAIISTGNELVDIRETPQAHQIRRSNSYALQTGLTSMGCTPTLYHLPDDRNALDRELPKILNKHQLIILSGGVSKGKLDFVPTTLESLGVNRLFHEVSQKPGKPFWFGATKKQVVFALPGNPVSTFLCFYRYIKPWLLRSMGEDFKFGQAVLAKDFEFVPPLTYFLQVKISNDNGVLKAIPDEGGGSGDLTNLKDVDGFLELPHDRCDFKAGDVFPFIPFRS